MLSSSSPYPPIIRQLRCPKGPQDVSSTDFASLHELGNRLSEAGGYLLGTLITGSGSATDKDRLDQYGLKTPFQWKDRVLGSNYFLQSGKCSAVGGSPACRGQPRYLYMRNIPTIKSTKGMISGLTQDVVDVADVVSLTTNVFTPCVEQTLPVGSRFYDTSPFTSKEAFLKHRRQCYKDCERSNHDSIERMNCYKQNCEGGWWEETRCSPNPKTWMGNNVAREKNYNIPVNFLFRETFTDVSFSGNPSVRVHWILFVFVFFSFLINMKHSSKLVAGAVKTSSSWIESLFYTNWKSMFENRDIMFYLCSLIIVIYIAVAKPENTPSMFSSMWFRVFIFVFVWLVSLHDPVLGVLFGLSMVLSITYSILNEMNYYSSPDLQSINKCNESFDPSSTSMTSTATTTSTTAIPTASHNQEPSGCTSSGCITDKASPVNEEEFDQYIHANVSSY
jgi:hypothetical protein